MIIIHLGLYRIVTKYDVNLIFNFHNDGIVNFNSYYCCRVGIL